VAKGAKHKAGCGVCDPTKSAISWTVTGTGCLIGAGCYQKNQAEPVSGSCGKCDPTRSAISWSHPSTCLVTPGWSRRIGGTSSDVAQALAVDRSGNIFIAGSFSGTVDFGGGAVTSKGNNSDIFIASYTARGNFRWARTFGDAMSDTAKALAMDNSGHLYVTGYFYDKANFGGGTLTAKGGGTDVFVASFTNNGAHRWSKSFGAVTNEYADGIAVTSTGEVVVVGYFSDPVNFGGTLLTTHGSNDIFVLSLTSTGAHHWSKAFGGSSSDIPFTVAVDSKNAIYVTGYFNGMVDFGGGVLSSNSSDVFLLKLTSAGAHVWSKRFGGSSSDYGRGLAVDSKDNVLLTGNFYSTINFGGSTFSSHGSTDIFVASFTSAGVHNWSRGFGSSSSDYGYGITSDASNNVYLVGGYNYSVSFGGSTLNSRGNTDIFVASFTSAGVHRWSRGFGGSGADYAMAVGVDNNRGVSFTGYFQGSADFGGGLLSSKGSNDIPLVRLVQ